MKYSIKDWSKGLNYDSAEYELEPGFCSNVSNVRFRNGFAERVGGIASQTTSVVSPLWLNVYRNDLAFNSAYVMYASSTRAFVYNWGSPGGELTRFTEGVTISSITRAGTTATVTTSTAHGLSTGNCISVWGCLPTQYNGSFTIAVLTPTTFTYSMTADPGDSATTVGLYSANGQTAGNTILVLNRAATSAILTTVGSHGRSVGDIITVSGASPAAYNGTFVITTINGSNQFLYTMASDPGAGAAPVGSYVFNGSYSNFTNPVVVGARPQQWTGGSLNGVFVLNSPADGLYYWNGDLNTKLRKIPGSYVARVSRPFKNYMVQLAPAVSGTTFARRVAWSSAAEPGSIPSSFTALSTNDAGDVELAETGGELMDCLPLGDQNIIYKNDSRYAMQYVGGNEVFRFTKLPGSEGLLHRNCVADTPVGHFFISTSGQAMLHTGAECRDLSSGRVSLLLERREPTFVVAYTTFKEVWVFVPAVGFIDSPTRILIWNWEEDKWGIKDFAGSITISSAAVAIRGASNLSSYEQMLVGSDSNTAIGIAESGADDLGSAFTSMIERTGMDFGDADVVKNLQRSRWNFDATAGNTFNVYHGSAMTADADPTYKAPVTYTLGTTDYVNSRAIGGRYLAVKVTWTSSVIADGRIRSCDLDATPGGKR